jgi:hypothetical protein
MKRTSYKKVFQDCSATLCDAIISYEQPGYNPKFGECIELCFSEKQTYSSTVLTKQSARKLYERLKVILDSSESVSL